MKKTVLTILALAACAMLFAQEENSLKNATELYNNGAAALQTGDKATALQYFEKATQMAATLGEDGKGIAEQCKAVIPQLNLSTAKDLIKAASFDEAIAQLKATIDIADKNEAFEVMGEATNLIPQVMMQKAGALYNAKDFAGAAAAFKDVLDINPQNGMAALRMGAAYMALGQTEEAKAAFETAAANGQEKTATKQLGGMYLKMAAASLKTKKYAEAVESAKKSLEYSETPQALQIAAQASQISGNNPEAIEYFEKYLAAAPTAKNAGQIAYTLGALYQQAGNKAKAKEFYAKAVTDPRYGVEAKKLLDSLK